MAIRLFGENTSPSRNVSFSAELGAIHPFLHHSGLRCCWFLVQLEELEFLLCKSGSSMVPLSLLLLGGDEKVQFLKSLNVGHVVNMVKENINESVNAFLKERDLKAIDVLNDPVGGKLTKESLKLLNWGAQILIIGFASGEVPVIPANIAIVEERCVVHEIGSSVDYQKMTSLQLLSLSLDSLLNYSDNDIEESTFELLLFAEALHEMLQYKMGCRLLDFLKRLRIKFVAKRNESKRRRDR